MTRLDALRKVNLGKRIVCCICVCAATATALSAQTFTTLFSFDGTDGLSPVAPLVQGTDGNLYGTAGYGGADAHGTIFKITPSGTVTTLYSFCSQSGCTDGRSPVAGLVQATDGAFYGTTATGGANKTGCFASGCGTVFKITSSGTLTTLHSFDGTDGYEPLGELVQATNGDLYGTTESGGANDGGTVFRITPAGALTTLYSFCSQTECADGDHPRAGLVQATNGTFYGTTAYGGTSGNYGTVFKITASGTLITLHSFNFTDGTNAYGGLFQAANGDFYGTTFRGGANCHIHGCGTIFKITPSGTLTTLYSFCSQSGCTDGEQPLRGVVQATDGNLYGTTLGGGSSASATCSLGHGCGTIFEITLSGMLTTLYPFCDQGGCTGGYNPYAELVQATNGDFYGTTLSGGGNGGGTVFSVSVGLGPFVETRPTSGNGGANIEILGTNLTGATSVSFNGAAAVFKVVSTSLITTTVPAGATTGKIQVVTPTGTLSSNVAFRVRP